MKFEAPRNNQTCESFYFVYIRKENLFSCNRSNWTGISQQIHSRWKQITKILQLFLYFPLLFMSCLSCYLLRISLLFAGPSDVFVCGAEEFPCGNTSICLDRSRHCDNFKDCPHGEDELGCSKFRHFLKNNYSRTSY